MHNGTAGIADTAKQVVGENVSGAGEDVFVVFREAVVVVVEVYL